MRVSVFRPKPLHIILALISNALLLLLGFFRETGKCSIVPPKVLAVKQSGTPPEEYDFRPASTLFSQNDIDAMSTEQYEYPRMREWIGPGAEHVELFHALLSSSRAGLYVDVGANEGVLMTLAAMMGNPAIGVEAIAQNYVKLLNIIEKRGYQKNMKVVHAAASDRSGSLVAFKENFNVELKQRNGQQLTPNQQVSPETVIQYTTTVTLDSILDSSVLLLKLDCEGTEFLALNGAKNLFSSRKVKYVHFEFSPGNMASISGQGSPNRMLHFMISNGYRVYVEDCSHDVSAEVIKMLPCRCAKQTDAGYAEKFRDLDFSNLADYELSQDTVDDFVSVLLEASQDGSMLVNILSVRDDDK